MAFNPPSLVRVGQAGVNPLNVHSDFIYGTNDAPATVETASYFTDKRLRKGDIIRASMSRLGTPVGKSYIVTAVAGSGAATIALFTTTAA